MIGLKQEMNAETRHRQRKRQLEMQAILLALKPFLEEQGRRGLQILEFGAGDGFQAAALQPLGKVTASDLEIRDSLKQVTGIETAACSITNTPFLSGRFDLVFSNHVIEHLENLPEAFRELHRIGKPECLYAFSVPTNLWLLLSLPAQFASKFRRLNKGPEKKSPESAPGASGPAASRSLFERFLPHGHGIEERFWPCYRQFKISAWKALFCRFQFKILKVQPLLLYGPSEFPVIPTLSAPRWGNLCSSVLFILQKEPRAAGAGPSILR